MWYFLLTFPNSSGWWWLVSSVFLTRTSCCKITHANGYYDALHASWETCTQVKKQVGTGHGTTDWFQIGKGCTLPPCLFNFYAEYIMWNAWLDELQTRIKITRRNTNNLRYADDTTLMAESEEELKSLLMKVKEESEKAGLKLNIQKMKIMASDPITSWQIDRETMETVTDCIFLGSKITADGDCSHEIKTHTSWKESYDKPRQHIKKQRHHFANKGPSSQSYGFSSGHVWMWELDHKQGWGQRIDAFELWCWRRLLRVPWTARRSNQSILKEINSEYSLEGLTVKLKLQYFGHLMHRDDSLEKSLMLGKIEDRRRRGQQDEMVGWHHWPNGHEFE